MSNWVTHKTLLNRAKDPDDHAAWQDFAEYYTGFVRAALYKMDIYEAYHDDVIQEILVKVWRKLPEFEIDPERATFRSWFSYIIRNTMINYMKKVTRTAEKHDLYADDVHARWATIAENDFELLIEREWQLHLTNMAMERVQRVFSGKAIEVFTMSLDGKSSDEIANKLQIAVTSVYKLKGRVRDCLVKEITNLRQQMEIE